MAHPIGCLTGRAEFNGTRMGAGRRRRSLSVTMEHGPVQEEPGCCPRRLVCAHIRNYTFGGYNAVFAHQPALNCYVRDSRGPHREPAHLEVNVRLLEHALRASGRSRSSRAVVGRAQSPLPPQNRSPPEIHPAGVSATAPVGYFRFRNRQRNQPWALSRTRSMAPRPRISAARHRRSPRRPTSHFGSTTHLAHR